MSIITDDCPRCGAERMTFDVYAQNLTGVRYDWQQLFEVFCRCRRCGQSTIFNVAQKEYSDRSWITKSDSLLRDDLALESVVKVESYVNISHQSTSSPPEHVPDNIAVVFREGATCMAVECWNAAGTMFRLCVDLTTRPMLPDGEVEGLNNKKRRDLGLRLAWLFENNKLPAPLNELSACIREDGNDAAHQGTLGKEDAEELLDFTTELLERIYTDPMRLKAAEARRVERRKKN